MDPVELLALLGGVAERGALVGRNRSSPSALVEAVADGRILRVRRGCYALPGADPVRVAEGAWRGTATCITAARELGLPVLTSDRRVHLLFPGDRTFSGRHLRPPASVRPHFAGRRPPALLSVAEIIDATGACVTPEQQLVLVDAALHRGSMLGADLARWQVTSVRRSRWLERHADERSESPLETLLRLAMRRAGLRVESQAYIEGIGRVDFLVEGRVIVEADGRAFHSDPVTFAQDRRRDRAAAARGMPVLRFTYAEIIANPDGAALEVLAVSSRAVPTARK